MSSVRSGSSMRSISRRPWLSNKQSSTLWALAENNAKLVPRPSQLAPRRVKVPADTRIESAFRDEKYRCQGREGEVEFVLTFRGMDLADVADIAAAVMDGVRIECFPPLAAKRRADPIVIVHVRRKIHDHHTTGACILA